MGISLTSDALLSVIRCLKCQKLHKGRDKKLENGDVTPSKDIRSAIKFCVSVNMTPVDTFKLISRGTIRVQHSEVNRCHKRFADGETVSGR